MFCVCAQTMETTQVRSVCDVYTKLPALPPLPPLPLLCLLGPTHPKHLLSIAASAYFPRSCCFVDIVFAQVADFSQCVVCFVVSLFVVVDVVVVSVTNFAA